MALSCWVHPKGFSKKSDILQPHMVISRNFILFCIFAVLPWLGCLGQTVYICGGQFAYAYHSSQSCTGLNNCRADVSYLSRSRAINEYDRRPCCICWSNTNGNCINDGKSGESSGYEFRPYRSVAPNAGLGVAVGVSKRDALPTSSILTEEGSVFIKRFPARDFDWWQIGKWVGLLVDGRQWEKQAYRARPKFIQLTSNSLLIYLVSNGQQRDCYCEKVSAIEWKCGYDYINHMIYGRSPDDFAFRLKNGNLYFFYYTFWNTVKRQDVYSGVAIKD